MGEMEERVYYSTERKAQHEDQSPDVISKCWKSCDSL